MNNIVKILAFIAAVLCAVCITVFMYCGFLHLQQGNMEHVAASAIIVFCLVFAFILCTLELTSE